MNTKKIIGIILVICGVAMLLFSNYINTQIAEGNLKIAAGQQQIDTAGSLFSLSPATKDVGKGVTQMGQSRINEGNQQIMQYTTIANMLMIGGIIVIVVGVGVFLLGFKKK